MGFNTVLMVLNDHLDVGAKDPEIGRRIRDAVCSYPARDRDRHRLDIYARSDRCSASYASVISQAHADDTQVVVVGRNYGQPISECDKLDWWTIKQITAALERNGYRVMKASNKATD